MDDLTRYYTENKALRAEVAALQSALKVAQDEAAWLLAERDKDGAMIEAISAEHDALRKDAERWRYLKSLTCDEWDNVFGACPRSTVGHELDKYVDRSIDAALKEGK